MTDQDRTEKVARALRIAEGNNPDADHTTHELDQEHTRLRENIVPRWTTYLTEARKLVAGLRTLGLLE